MQRALRVPMWGPPLSILSECPTLTSIPGVQVTYAMSLHSGGDTQLQGWGSCFLGPQCSPRLSWEQPTRSHLPNSLVRMRGAAGCPPCPTVPGLCADTVPGQPSRTTAGVSLGTSCQLLVVSKSEGSGVHTTPSELLWARLYLLWRKSFL